jgi:hypothetical protein
MLIFSRVANWATYARHLFNIPLLLPWQMSVKVMQCQYCSSDIVRVYLDQNVAPGIARVTAARETGGRLTADVGDLNG